ncbi:hypothetical protein H8959_016728 [Pygathrix nigripes]
MPQSILPRAGRARRPPRCGPWGLQTAAGQSRPHPVPGALTRPCTHPGAGGADRQSVSPGGAGPGEQGRRRGRGESGDQQAAPGRARRRDARLQRSRLGSVVPSGASPRPCCPPAPPFLDRCVCRGRPGRQDAEEEAAAMPGLRLPASASRPPPPRNGLLQPL